MNNDKQKRGYRDWSRVNLTEQYEAAYWEKRFGVSREILEKAIRRIGPIVEDVEAFLSSKDSAML